MKKLVLKTVYITILTILTVCIAVMSAFCIFKPRVIANMFDSLGKYEATQYFYQMQYKKTGEIDDLFIIIGNAYEKEDSQRLVSCVGELITHKDFREYCQTKNSTLKPNQMTTEEYYAGLYVEQLVAVGKVDKAINFAKSFVLTEDDNVDMGYTQFGPFRVLVNDQSQLNEDEKQALKEAIEYCQNIITDSVELGYIEQDLNKLN